MSNPLLKKLLGETALYGLSSIVGRLLNYLLVPLYTRQFTTGEYGVVSELYAYSGFVMVLFSYRMESAFFRFGTPEADRQRAYTTAVWSLLATTVVFLLTIALYADALANWLNYPQNPEYMVWFGAILAMDALSELPFARLRLAQQPRRFVAIKLLNIGLNIGLNLFWLVFCPWAVNQGYYFFERLWSPEVGVGYVFLSNLLASAITLLVLTPELRRIDRQFDLELWKRMLRYAAPLMVVGFAGIVNEMLDRALLTRLLPGTLVQNRAQLGIYAANYKLAMLITLFTQAYRYAAEPFFFRHAEGADSLKLQANAARWFTAAAAGAMLGILLFLEVVKGFIGERFHSGLKVVPILLLANVFLGIFYNFSVWYRLKDRTGTGALISIGSALVTVVLNLWWVPLYGYVGAAWATLVCYAFMCYVTWYLGRELHPVPYPLHLMVVYVGGALLLAGLAFGASLLLQGALLWVLRVVLMGCYAFGVWHTRRVEVLG
jgi:O-antigen/teichoic acid export membrane protein